MAQSAYDLYKKTYDKKMSAVKAQDALQTQEKADREAQAQKNLESSNRGVYTTYKQAINPFGVTAAQNSLPSGVSDYMKNAAYGTMLQGLGSNQNNFQEAMNNSNSLWYSWLADKAGMESDALSEYNNAVVAQQNYDKEQEEAKRQFDEELAAKRAVINSGGSGSPDGTPVEDPEEGKTPKVDWSKYYNTGFTGSTASDKGFGDDYKSGTYTLIETINGVKYKRTYKNGQLIASTKA